MHHAGSKLFTWRGVVTGMEHYFIRSTCRGGSAVHFLVVEGFGAQEYFAGGEARLADDVFELLFGWFVVAGHGEVDIALFEYDVHIVCVEGLAEVFFEAVGAKGTGEAEYFQSNIGRMGGGGVALLGMGGVWDGH